MQKITPHLWFDKEAKQAIEFYTSIFSNARIKHTTTIHDTPSGDCDIVSFELAGQPFMAINAGPLFKFNPSISFMVNFDPSKDHNAETNLDILWNNLSKDGKVLMPLDKYFFSDRYGWIQDKYGVSWQLILTKPNGEERPHIIPLLFYAGQAEEAVHFYLSVFEDSALGFIAHYEKGKEPRPEGGIMFSDFMLNKQWFAAMDGVGAHEFSFNEAISLLIPCETQAEIDYFWQKLSAEPNAEQCGWLKDKFGVSWQVWPTYLGEVMEHGTPEQIARVTKAFLAMKKYDIGMLQKAYEGN